MDPFPRKENKEDRNQKAFVLKKNLEESYDRVRCPRLKGKTNLSEGKCSISYDYIYLSVAPVVAALFLFGQWNVQPFPPIPPDQQHSPSVEHSPDPPLSHTRQIPAIGSRIAFFFSFALPATENCGDKQYYLNVIIWWHEF
jgi:hypothetical protein